MTDTKKAAPAGSPIDTAYCGQEFTKIISRTATTKPASQIERVLLALLYNGSLNCQEAEHPPVNARHLNSVISELSNRHDLEVDREREQVKGYCGVNCYLTRYRLPFDQLISAKAMVNQLRARRKAAPVNWEKLCSTPLEKLLKSA
ncbi:hypothetical protein [Rheinheimera maricola]|uniref:Helix-turn-helix domain-containing protein n=1 Tax=Rheinheimera maricola TaxID=2793282 RepID=A0ABS7XAH9_9GAMM|nr:hypothetical protein [Rheinheimera maricola]MBZ9612566.1 hypothetical protein [Rheinheimera maricola]